MKLLALANRYYIFTLIIVFSLGGLIAYFIIKTTINNEFNRKLMAEKDQLIYELHNYENLQQSYSLNIGDKIELKEVQKIKFENPILIDTTMHDDFEEIMLPFRLLIFNETLNDKIYQVTISKPLLPNEDLITAISEIMIGIFVALLLSLVFVNRYVSRKIWQPFYNMIDMINRFNLRHPKKIKFQKTTINEFRDLKNVLESMIQKTIADYKNLKEYTENTSHEIQTPLAIIKNKAELLLQDDLTEAQLNEIASIYESATRLSKLKESLALLTRIDNNQYIEIEAVNIKQLIEDKLEQLSELIDYKNIKVKTKYYAEPIVMLNINLASILFNNLINNAIKHNINNGRISISLKENEFIIENSGNKLQIDPKKVFNRYSRNLTTRNSVGVGLSLVKRIVEHYNMKVSYHYNDMNHQIVLLF